MAAQPRSLVGASLQISKTLGLYFHFKPLPYLCVQLVNKVQSNQMELTGQNIVVDNRKLSFAGVTISAVIGGIAEKLGRGKPVRPGRGGFANGAVTGAYVMMFNHVGNEIQKRRTEKMLEDIVNTLGITSTAIDEGMQLILVSDLELRQALIDQGYSTKRVDQIINRSATTGGVASIGGRILFWGQAGYNVYDAFYANPSVENMIIRTADTYFSYLATYGGLKGMAIAGIFFIGKESIIMTIQGLEQSLIIPNPHMMRNYIPGLAPTPFIQN
ncbi:MAG: hypothetical protein ACOCVN_00890 [bacterium]